MVDRTRTSDNEVVNILWATDNYIHFGEGGFNVRRFATRALACGERVRYPTIFPKSLIRYLMNEG